MDVCTISCFLFVVCKTAVYNVYECETNSRLPGEDLSGTQDVCSRCTKTLCSGAAVLLRTYLGERTLLGQRALVGLPEQLFEGVPHGGVGPLLRRQLLKPGKAAHVTSFVIIRRIKLSITYSRVVEGGHVGQINQPPAIII